MPTPDDSPRSPPNLRALFIDEGSYVWRTLRRLGVREADLEDLTHDVFVVIQRSGSSYDPTRPIRPWLFGIAFRVASDHRRKGSAVREELQLEIEAEDQRPSAEDQLVDSQHRTMVLQALETLSEDRRAVLVMHDLDEESVPEIARTLGIPVNTAYSRLRLARADFVAEIRRMQKAKPGAARLRVVRGEQP